MKPNLVLTHSFPTNSMILKGFVDYLQKYFEIYFIDLPGFRKNIPALNEISIENYAHYVEDNINQLDLDKYILGGISFGFLVINNVETDDRCKAIMAIEPFLGNTLKVNFFKKLSYSIFLKTILLLKLEKILWNTNISKKLMSREFNYPEDRFKTIFDEIHPGTFIKTLHLLLNYNTAVKYKEKPYALFINREDDRIKGSETMESFKHLKNLFILETTVQHFPKDLSVSYFENNISKKDINSLQNWIKIWYK
jgi:hypothetical protein